MYGLFQLKDQYLFNIFSNNLKKEFIDLMRAHKLTQTPNESENFNAQKGYQNIINSDENDYNMFELIFYSFTST